MKRYLQCLLIAALVLSLVGVAGLNKPAQAQEAPTGVWFGTWPYVLPPEHSFNAYVTNGGLETNLGVGFRSYVELLYGLTWATGSISPARRILGLLGR